MNELALSTQGAYGVLLVALLLAGLVMGFMSGLLGIGGGGILVPALYEVLGAAGLRADLVLPVAIGTSLCVMIPTSVRAFMIHKERGAADFALLKQLAPWILAGVLAGSITVRYAGGDAIKWLWVIFGSLLAAKFAFARADWRIGNEMPRGPLLHLYGALIGFISTMMSIGGGAFATTLMTLYGRPILQAVATSAGVGPLIAIPGAAGFIWAGWGVSGLLPGSLGYVNLIGAAIIIPISYWAAPYGVRTAHSIKKRTLELIFAVFIALVTIRFFFSLIA